MRKSSTRAVVVIGGTLAGVSSTFAFGAQAALFPSDQANSALEGLVADPSQSASINSGSATPTPTETKKAAESVINAFKAVKANLLVQEFIKEANATDIRCFVIGNKVVASMQRQGAEGDFRSNLHRGGTASSIKITPEERSTAVRAARAMGLNVAGVDMLRSKYGPVIMEVNSSPGLEGIEKASGKDIASKIIAFIEENASHGKTKTKGKG